MPGSSDEERLRIIGLGVNSLRKSHYQELRRTVEELRVLNAELEERVAAKTRQLLDAEKQAALGHLMAGMAHVVNTPVGTAFTSASFILDRAQEIRTRLAADSLGRRDLESFMESLETGLGLVYRNLERFAQVIQRFRQMVADQETDIRKRVYPAEVVDDVLLSLQEILGDRMPVMEVNPALWVETLPGALFQVLWNLIRNGAVHGVPPGGKPGDGMSVRIFLPPGGTGVVMEVEDRGPGLPPDVSLNPFEPFRSLSGSGHSGEGLGLAISWHLVTDRLGGTLTHRSGEGGGSVFRVEIPCSSCQESSSE